MSHIKTARMKPQGSRCQRSPLKHYSSCCQFVVLMTALWQSRAGASVGSVHFNGITVRRVYHPEALVGLHAVLAGCCLRWAILNHASQ